MTEEKIMFEDTSQQGETTKLNKPDQREVDSSINTSPSTDTPKSKKKSKTQLEMEKIKEENNKLLDALEQMRQYYSQKIEEERKSHSEESIRGNTSIPNMASISVNDNNPSPENSGDTKLSQINRNNSVSQSGLPQNDINKTPEHSKLYLSIMFWIKYTFFYFASSLTIMLISRYVFLIDNITSFIIGVIGACIVVFAFYYIREYLKNRALKPKKLQIKKTNGDIEVASMDVLNVKRCPVCNEKLLKTKVKFNGEFANQILKCSSPICDFKKELSFRMV